MDTFKSFEEYLPQFQSDISLLWFVINIIYAGVAGYILKYIYSNFGNTLSNRSQFGKIFPLIAMTTMLIITIVKSSLALSLGLVGALSIIRFRAAIKEPEELAYIFITISVGLGLGANQMKITTTALVLIILLIIFSKKTSFIDKDSNNLFITLQTNKPSSLNIEKITSILESYCKNISLKRLDQSKDSFESSFIVEFIDHNKMFKCRSEILELDESISCSFLDNKRIY